MFNAGWKSKQVKDYHQSFQLKFMKLVYFSVIGAFVFNFGKSYKFAKISRFFADSESPPTLQFWKVHFANWPIKTSAVSFFRKHVCRQVILLRETICWLWNLWKREIDIWESDHSAKFHSSLSDARHLSYISFLFSDWFSQAFCLNTVNV